MQRKVNKSRIVAREEQSARWQITLVNFKCNFGLSFSIFFFFQKLTRLKMHN